LAPRHGACEGAGSWTRENIHDLKQGAWREFSCFAAGCHGEKEIVRIGLLKGSQGCLMMRMSDGQPSGVIKTMDEGWLVTTSDDVADEQQTIISGHRDDG
jgi:hypothetical protein